MRGECTKHGEVEIIRGEDGRLRCSQCLEANHSEFTAAKEKRDEAARRDRAKRVVEHLFDPDRLEAERARRMDLFKDALVDALADREKHKEGER